MDPIDRTLEFILNTSWSDIPAAVQDATKLALLDNLGAQIAGFQTPVSQILTDFALSQYQIPAEATVLVGGQKVSAIGASLANGFMANALDIDDGHKSWAWGHPGPCLIPPLLAAAEKFKPDCSGADFLTALLVGYETAIRAGKIRHETYAAYHSSGSWGAIGGAAAIGSLIKLDRKILREALGTAEYHAPIGPMRKGIIKPAMVKDSIGWGCFTAMSSVLLAMDGFTGVNPIFGDSKDPSVIESLGVDFKVTQLTFKQFPSCRWNHPAVTAALNLKKKYNPPIDQIESIVVRSHRDAQTLPLKPPRDTEEAQYTMAHPVAAALIDGELGPKQQTPPRLFDQDIRDMIGKVNFELDSEFDAAYLGRELASVTVKLKDGTVFESGPTEPNWRENKQPTLREIEEKFTWLVKPVLGGVGSRFVNAQNLALGPSQTAKLKHTVLNLEDYNVSELIQLSLKKPY